MCSFEGLQEPTFLLGLEYRRAKTSTGYRRDGGDGGRVSEGEILAEGYMSVPLEEDRAGGKVMDDVNLENGADTVRLRYSTQSATTTRQ